jgi:hypothetical protein
MASNLKIKSGKTKMTTITSKKRWTKSMSSFLSTVQNHPSLMVIAIIVAITGILVAIQPLFIKHTYSLGNAGALLSPINQSLSGNLKYNNKDQTFTFNDSQVLPSPEVAQTGTQKLTALAHQDPSKGLTVTDDTNKVDFSLTPKYSLLSGKQDGNRIVYPLTDGTGWAVYTMSGTGVKEDVVLNKSDSNTKTFDYNLGISDGLEARLEVDGGIGIYGNTLFSGNISASSDKDAALLIKARQAAKKDKLLFVIPKPIILQANKKQSSAKATYSLKGKDLKVTVTGLQKANYPLSIDPSIYVVTAQQFMNGNNETNIDFDVANKLIEKGTATGARFNTWNSTTSLPNSTWRAGSVAAGGYIYTIGGSSTGSAATASVSWAKFNTTTGTVDSANPGNGTCSSWCTSSAYNLPSGRSSFSLVAYNGFLYVFGGNDSAGAKQNTVYIAKIGANGEPQLWHPTDPNKTNWVYWYQDTSLSSVRAATSATAYNNRMYLVGGSSTSGPVNTVEIADINPTGTLGTWTASTALPVALSGHDIHIYNDRLYAIGGASTVSGAPLNSVYYNKVNGDGTLNNWIATTSFSTGRITGGGNFSVIWGAYLYISGGCTAVNVSGYCTAVAANTQVASINADGSLDTWSDVGGVSNQRMGFGMIAWRNTIYEIGGCSAQNTSTGDCNTSMLGTIIYGSINQDGDASTVGQSVASGTAPCSGTTPTDCNLPGTTYIGNMLSAAVITNGYLYVIGGCTNNTCSTTSGNVAYTAISSTGTMTKPATCPTGAYQGGDWCVDTTHVVAGGIAATSPVIFGNRIYLVGGLKGTANTNAIVYSTVNTDGSIGAWTSQSMTGLGANSVSYLYSYARANPSSAGTNPGNLYIFGGCATSSAAGCTAYSQNVYKCNILTTGAVSACSTTGQLQIGIVPGDSATGLGIMSGTVYANYIYLIGGVSPNQVDLTTTRYAKFDNNNNIVAASGSTWTESPNQMLVGRRRAAAFGYNGYIYVVGGYEGVTGVLADIEFIKVNVSDGSIGDATLGFQASSVTINQRWGLSVPVSNSYAYVIGGCTVGASPGSCTTRTDVIQTFQLYNNDSGAPAGYSTSANTWALAPNRVGASSVILNGYIYTAGGCTSVTDCTNAISDVSYAPIDVNGAIGTWTSTTAGLPNVRAWGRLEVAGGTLYYIGGQSSTATDRRTEIYYGTPAAGNVTTWNTATNPLPSGRTKFAATVWNNRIYVVGGEGTGTGCTASNVCNTVYMSPQLNAGGNITSAWSTASTSFNVARSGLTAVAYANNMYIFGGYDGANYLSDSQYSQLNASTGLAGTWTYSASLPGPLSQADGFAANGYVYLIGGRSSDLTCDPTTLIAPISANTTIATGNNPTGIGAWYETNQRYTGSRYGASAVYNDGKAYVLGGACGVATPTVIDNTAGVSSYTVPAGITSITVKAWGGGGGGGTGTTGGAGGGGGYATSTISVTPGEVLSVSVGGAGGGGARNTSGRGGGGGGESGIRRSDNSVAIIASGGGGGGGAKSTSGQNGGAGGAGGGTTGTAGTAGVGTAPLPGGGQPGAPSAGGAGGTATGEGGSCVGQTGGYLDGGNGADGRSSGTCTYTATGTAGVGFITGAGEGGSVVTTTRAGAGGGGSGYYGGGGGASSGAQGGAGGGGGGASFTTGINASTLGGSGQTPGNSADTDRAGAGAGANGGSGTAVGATGTAGIVIINPVAAFNYASPVVQQTAVLSQPQVAKYSIMIDTDSDVYPNQWLLNGIDNSIGAKWQLKYRSMTNTTTSCAAPAMTTWGVETNFGNVTLGLPGVYTPLDGSATTTNCARFYYFNVTVDSSQAFGYPDDVTRGPTITDLTLQFTADPSKRLMHGRTFTGGLQQPVDTPYYTH